MFPKQCRIRRVCLKGAKLGGKDVKRWTVTEHAFGDEGVTVALGGGRYIDIVVFRMVLHAPKSTALKGECRRLHPKIVAGQDRRTARQRGDPVAVNRRRLEHGGLADEQEDVRGRYR